MIYRVPASTVVPEFFKIEHGQYKLTVQCPNCGALDGWDCRPGSWPQCWRCGARVLAYGKTPSAECVTPNGRIDSHMAYVRISGDGESVCAFCGKKV